MRVGGIYVLATISVRRSFDKLSLLYPAVIGATHVLSRRCDAREQLEEVPRGAGRNISLRVPPPSRRGHASGAAASCVSMFQLRSQEKTFLKSNEKQFQKLAPVLYILAEAAQVPPLHSHSRTRV
jgi:hypothetical protein